MTVFILKTIKPQGERTGKIATEFRKLESRGEGVSDQGKWKPPLAMGEVQKGPDSQHASSVRPGAEAWWSCGGSNARGLTAHAHLSRTPQRLKRVPGLDG